VSTQWFILVVSTDLWYYQGCPGKLRSQAAVSSASLLHNPDC
jgi:hypothetical protein